MRRVLEGSGLVGVVVVRDNYGCNGYFMLHNAPHVIIPGLMQIAQGCDSLLWWNQTWNGRLGESVLGSLQVASVLPVV
eukprot:2650631-Amphidinium_carterae.1